MTRTGRGGSEGDSSRSRRRHRAKSSKDPSSRRSRRSASATDRPRSFPSSTARPVDAVTRPTRRTPRCWRTPRSRSSGGPEVPTSWSDGSRRAAARVGHRVDGAGQAAGDLEPPVGVQAAVAARHAGVPPDGEGDLAARAGELVGDLDARGRGSDDEHAAGRQCVGAAVGAGRDHALRVEAGRDPRTSVRPGRDHDVVGAPDAGVGVDEVAVVGAGDLVHAGAGHDGSVERRGVLLQVLDEGAGPDEGVGIGAGGREVREPGHPRRGEQVQGVPAFGAPALGHPAAIEDDVVDPGLGSGAGTPRVRRGRPR